MNWNQIESNWKELKGNIQQQWAELTNSDIDNMSGNREELTSKIQQTYSMDRQSAENEVDTWQNSQDDFGDDNELNDKQLEGNDVGGNSNTMHANKFGYDETSSNQIQSGEDNNTMPGTNNLSANAKPYNLDTTLSANGNSQPSNGHDGGDDSQGPGDAGGVPGAIDDDGINDDIDELNNPNLNPLPNEKTPPIGDVNKTDHQEKSIDQT